MSGARRQERRDGVDGATEADRPQTEAQGGGTPSQGKRSRGLRVLETDAQGVQSTPDDVFTALRQEAEQRHLTAAAVVSLETLHHSLSLAEERRRRTRPWRIVWGIVAVLFAAIVPYWVGRRVAIWHTGQVMLVLRCMDPLGWALVGWTIVTVLFAVLGLALVVRRRGCLLALALALFALSQLVSGMSLLKSDFWYGTFAIYGKGSFYANAVNLGMIASASGLFVFSIVFVTLMVFARNGSKAKMLLRGWSAFAFFLICELAAICIVLFCGVIQLMG